MKPTRFFMLIGALAMPLMLHAETWNDVSLVDANCAAKVKANPDAHTRDCAVQCSKSGYGILSNGKFLPFDSAGNKQAVAALDASTATDHLRVTVTGDRQGDTIQVKTLKLD